MAITTLSAVQSAPRQDIAYVKASATNPGAGTFLSYWRVAGTPGTGTDPSSGAAGQALTVADAGAVSFVNPASGLTYLSRFSAGSSVEGSLLIYDRLWHNSGLSPTVTTAQTVNSVALPARCPVLTDATGQTFDTNGNQVEAWFQVMGTAMGAGTVAPTISYTNQSGTAGRTATLQNWVSAIPSNRTFPFDLAAGDSGVRSIQSYTQTATQTSGAFSLVLRRRIATLRLPMRDRAFGFDWDALALPVVPNSAHLEFLWIPASAVSVGINGELSLIQG